MALDQLEIKILRELRSPYHIGWMTPVEIAERIDEPRWKVAAVLNQLRRRFLVKRGNVTLGHWGEFSITETGMVELAGADQLRLVK